MCEEVPSEKQVFKKEYWELCVCVCMHTCLIYIRCRQINTLYR